MKTFVFMFTALTMCKGVASIGFINHITPILIIAGGISLTVISNSLNK